MSGAATRSVYVSRSARRAGTLPAEGRPLKPKGLNDSKTAQLAEVGAQLERLRPYANKLRSQLPQSAAQVLSRVAATVAILRGTEHYEGLKALVLESFRERPYEIGTVGAYFVNCADPAARDSCSPACVGNLVLADGVEDVCPVRVFVLKHEGHSTRVLLAVNDVPAATPEGPVSGAQKGMVYIYLEDSGSIAGLTQGEIATLRGLGISEVRVAYYDPCTTETTDVTPGFVSLGSLVPVPAYASTGGSGFWLTILIIVVVGALVALLWALFRKHGEGPGGVASAPGGACPAPGGACPASKGAAPGSGTVLGAR